MERRYWVRRGLIWLDKWWMGKGRSRPAPYVAADVISVRKSRMRKGVDVRPPRRTRPTRAQTFGRFFARSARACGDPFFPVPNMTPRYRALFLMVTVAPAKSHTSLREPRVPALRLMISVLAPLIVSPLSSQYSSNRCRSFWRFVRPTARRAVSSAN